MEKFILYVYTDKGIEEYAAFKDRFGYKNSAEKLFRMKLGGNVALTDADKIFKEAVVEGVKVLRGGFTKVMQSLRHFDEIGLSNDIYEVMEEITEDKNITAVSLNKINGRETDFKEYAV